MTINRTGRIHHLVLIIIIIIRLFFLFFRIGGVLPNAVVGSSSNFILRVGVRWNVLL